MIILDKKYNKTIFLNEKIIPNQKLVELYDNLISNINSNYKNIRKETFKDFSLNTDGFNTNKFKIIKNKINKILNKYNAKSNKNLYYTTNILPLIDVLYKKTRILNKYENIIYIPDLLYLFERNSNNLNFYKAYLTVVDGNKTRNPDYETSVDVYEIELKDKYTFNKEELPKLEKF